MVYHGKIQLAIVIVAPPDQVKEGEPDGSEFRPDWKHVLHDGDL